MNDRQQRRADKRAEKQEQEAIAVPKNPWPGRGIHVDPDVAMGVGKVAQHEPTARGVFLWVTEGEGWSYAVADVPESVLRQYIVEQGGPDILAVSMGRSQMALEQHVAKGVR